MNLQSYTFNVFFENLISFLSSAILTMPVFTLFVVLFGHFTTILGFLGNSSTTSLSRSRTFGRDNYLPQASHGGGWGSSGSHGGGWGWGSGGHGSGGSFQSFFDIALTGLAFLSFGIFLLNLLLNALLGAGIITGTITPTGTGTGIITDTGTGTGTGSGRARNKRSVFSIEVDRVSSAEVMASVILQSIDAMVNEHECIQKVFCDGNKDAKSVGNGFQYSFPAYSFGASYLAQKLGLYKNLSDHVGAIFHGMENSNCQQHFPQC